MELRTTREMRRNEQLARAAGQRTETPEGSAKSRPQPAQRAALSDKLTLSQQAIEFLDQRQAQLQQELEDHWAGQQERLAQTESQTAELKMLEKGLDMLDKCMKIAAAIMRGDKVPPQDLKYLMDKDPTGYKLAMALRQEKKDPKEMESVLGDEDSANPAEEAGGEETAGTPEGTPAVSD